MVNSDFLFPPSRNVACAPRLLIVGSSTRAAAWSAVRAGYWPVCADQFADLDLRQIAEVISVRNYPISLPADLAHVSSDGWLFAGAMERYPDVLAQLRQMPQLGALVGCHEFAISPQEFTAAAQSAGLPILELWPGKTDKPPADGTWVRKIHPGGGGFHVRLWDESSLQDLAFREQTHEVAATERVYFQRRGTGISGSALFNINAASKNASTHSRVRFLGATRQLIGHPSAAPPVPFAYCGNVGPVLLPDDALRQLCQMVEVLSLRHSLAGIVGIDFLQQKDQISPVELNPRYTAACEILELAGQRPLLSLADVVKRTSDLPQGMAMNDDLVHAFPVQNPSIPDKRMIGKLILYADRPLHAPDFQRFLRPRSAWSVPFLADIPAKGTLFRKGDPLCTVFARGVTEDDVEQRLIRRAGRVRQWFLR